MLTFEYPARLEAGDEGAIVVSFPDVPEAITEGDDRAQALANAAEALGLALLTYPRRGLPIPRPRETRHDMPMVAIDTATAAKLAVLEAFREAGISKCDLARRIGRDEKEVRRILDPMHSTRIATLSEVLAALGHRIVISLDTAA